MPNTIHAGIYGRASRLRCSKLHARMNNQAVQDWLSIRRTLLQKEAAFTELAMRTIHGEVSEADLEMERKALEGTRELCSEAYRRAFPPISGSDARSA